MSYNINYTVLKEELGLEKEDVDMLVEVFLETSKHDMDKLKEAIDKNDFEAISETAHSIKGASGNLRLNKIYEIAKLIELSAKERKSIDYLSKYKELENLIRIIKEQNL